MDPIRKEMGDQWRFDAAGWSCHRGKILYNLFVSFGRFPKPLVHGPLDTEHGNHPFAARYPLRTRRPLRT